MIFPGFPGVLSFFQVFQVEWEPCYFTQALDQQGSIKKHSLQTFSNVYKEFQKYNLNEKYYFL